MRRATGSATSARRTSCSLRTEMLPEGVERRCVWELAGGDRIAFENISDLLHRAPLPPERDVPCGQPDVQPQPVPGAGAATALARAPARRAARGRAARATAFAELDRRARHVGFDELRAALGADPGALGEALLEGFRASG